MDCGNAANEEIPERKRRSSEEINRLVVEFETSALRPAESAITVWRSARCGADSKGGAWRTGTHWVGAGLLKNVTDLGFRFMNLRQLLFPLAFLLAVLSVAATKSDTPVDTALTETMSTMHDAMHDVQLTGKPDIDFARLMIPHHQGAIDMAKVELLFGTDARLRRLAQEIIVTQESEIQLMQKILRESNE